jgi:soluble lytic murein transglycosylase-like protein
MKSCLAALVLLLAASCNAQATNFTARNEAEYYARAYAQHYGVPVNLVRSIIQQESGWNACVVSSKGAVGLMQLMPETASRLGVKNRCDIRQNISGGVHYLAWLIAKFHGDLRLAVAAYYAGEQVVERRGLKYRNRDVVGYVYSVRGIYERQKQAAVLQAQVQSGRNVR